MTTVEWTTVQWGSSLASSWTDLPLVHPDSEVLLGVFYGGLVFDASEHQDLAAIESIDAIRLDVTSQRFDIGTVDTQVEIGVVPHPDAAPYSSAASPWSRSEVGLGIYLVPTTTSPNELRTSVELSGAALASIRTHVTDSPAWSGRLALSLRGTSHFFYLRNYPSSNLITAATMQTLFTEEEQEEQAVAGPGSMAIHPRVVVSQRPEYRRLQHAETQRSVPFLEGISGGVHESGFVRR